jgi:hypothetical protein
MDAHFAKRLEKQAGELLTIPQTQIREKSDEQ